MPTPTWPFNNTDLHNIYDAIVAGGGGGDLAGKLLDGTQDPSVPAGFYPSEINAINNHVSQTANNSAYLLNLFLGIDEPTNLSGFYPANLNAILTDCEAMVGILASIDANLPYAFQLFDGTRNPSEEGGFYPSHVIEDTAHLDKIEQHSASSMATEIALLQNTQFGDVSGVTILSKTGSGFATSLAAVNDLVGYMNNISGSFYVVNLNFTDKGGSNGHSYTLIYR